MTVFDYVFLAILGLSTLLGLWRGLVSEVLSLAGWVLALVLAWKGASLAEPYLAGIAANPWARWAVGFIAIFVLCLILMALLRWLMKELLRSAGLSTSDRLLGSIFGAVRGMLIALVLVLLAGLTALPKEPWWRDAVFAPPLETMVIALKPRLPEDLAKRLKYR
ncbi:CvpA family protein [Uliginosibacterium sp. H1]|uniref:CvpA family protein n=1 Tax=Uliginosibacterium sp. H1 TaxID=3114757 RepID=UPI002E181565|nr:CvpA family protein [Uliginosibacterium sp. H1]